MHSSSLTIVLHLSGINMVEFPVPMTRRMNSFSHVWHEWKAESDFTFYFGPTRPDAAVIGDTNQECSVAILRQPGKAAVPLLPPPIILRNGRPFISLSGWEDYVNAPFRHHEVKRVRIHWDETTHTATLTMDQRTVHFTLKRPQMTIDGQPPVSLPEGPFLSRRISDLYPSELFIPLQPLVTLFGGSMSFHPETREVVLHLPQAAPVK